jgi:microcystin-dependent protein
MIPYTGTTAPNSAFILPFGQAISRTTYATYFSLVSTAYGNGDGSTTFNVIDMRGRLPIGQDNMGGSAASRVTTVGSNIDGTTIGATGGAQNYSLLRTDLPNVDFIADGAGKIPSVTVTGGNLIASTTTPLQGTGGAFSAIGSTASPSANVGGHIYLNGNVTQTSFNKMPPGIIVPYILRVI